MSYALPSPATPRAPLLGAVIVAHVAAIWGLLMLKPAPVETLDTPIIVTLTEAVPDMPPEQPKSRPTTQQTASKPSPVVTKPTPQTEAPSVQPSSQIAAPSSGGQPVASGPESKPAPAAEPQSQARFDADYLKNPAPSYPPLSRRMREEGKVILRVLVSPSGTAESVEIKTSSGVTRLDESAMRTVREWKFIPAKRGDTAVQSWVLVPINFKLEQ